LAKGYIERPSALFGYWQKDTVRNQMCYTVPGKRIYGKGKDQVKRPSEINGTWQKKGLSMLYGTWQKDTWKEKDIR
jgi:hypothetical protein